MDYGAVAVAVAVAVGVLAAPYSVVMYLPRVPLSWCLLDLTG